MAFSRILKVYLYSPLLCVLAILSVSASATDDIVELYEQERDRIFSLRSSERLPALDSSTIFNPNLPIGKYFINSITLNTELFAERFVLSELDRAQLENAYPMYFYEGAISDVFEQKYSPTKSMEVVDQVIHIAQKQGWDRLKRWAVSCKYHLLIEANRFPEAIEALYTIKDQAPHIPTAAISYDYSISDIYFDLAMAYKQIGNYAMSIHYCDKFGAYSESDPKFHLEGEMCKARILLVTKRFTKALKVVYPVLEQSKERQLDDIVVGAYILIAQLNFKLGQFETTEEYALAGLEHLSTKTSGYQSDFLYFFVILADAYVGQNDMTNAHVYIKRARQISEEIGGYLGLQERMLQAEAAVAHATGDHALSAASYKALYELTIAASNQKANLLSQQEIRESLELNQLSYVQEELKTAIREKNDFAVIALFTAVIGLLILLYAWKHKHRHSRFKANLMIDNSSESYSHWYAINRINHVLKPLDQTHVSHCIAIVELIDYDLVRDTQSKAQADDILKRLATILSAKHSVPVTVGRYCRDQLIVLFEQACIYDVSRYFERVGLKAFETECRVTFAAIEVASSISGDIALDYCENLLSKARKSSSEKYARLNRQNELNIINPNIIKR